ncbi:hypothetical protein BFG60_2819 [Microcystis aeruginosa NIES-98]|nr:hypothetical protein BFG60_2819 [Microcystis aeruginosa NIES-98]
MELWDLFLTYPIFDPVNSILFSRQRIGFIFSILAIYC